MEKIKYATVDITKMYGGDTSYYINLIEKLKTEIDMLEEDRIKISRRFDDFKELHILQNQKLENISSMNEIPMANAICERLSSGYNGAQYREAEESFEKTIGEIEAAIQKKNQELETANEYLRNNQV